MSQPYPPPAGAPNVPNYLIPAIASTLLCCLPTGIASIVFATQVNAKIAAGDIAGAEAASKKAKMWMFISIGLGILVYVGVAIFYLVVGLAVLSGSSR
jgi:hypothetical protein